MALVTVLSYSFLDDAGKSDSMRVFFPATVTVAQVQSFSDIFAPLLDAVTGAVIDGATITLGLTLPAGLKADALDDSYKQVGVNFGFDAENTIYKHTMRVPAIDLTLLVDGNPNAGAAAITNLAQAVYNGAATISPSDRFANDLTGLVGVEKSFQRK